MNIVFVSNYINHHQIPVSDKLYELSAGQYTFIQTEPMEEERVKMGWDVNAELKPYVRFMYREKEACEKLIMEADCVIFGGCEDESIIRPRLVSGKFTVRYSERLYKEGRWKFISPRGLKKKYYDHTSFRKNDVYLLCAGAYVKGDFSLVRAYTGKMFKFGYFPKTEKYDDVHYLRKNNEGINILWAARFIDWKHPEMMVSIAGLLKEKNIKGHITMIGVGDMLDDINARVNKAGLNDYISFAGNKTPDEVREMMLRSDVFVSTSDMKEGWGAVINEAMNSGCVTIASYAMGAVPYLIKSGYNGLAYRAKSVNELLRHILWVNDHKSEARDMGARAYETICDLWNADVAAERLYAFICDRQHKIPEYKDGPLSRA